MEEIVNFLRDKKSIFIFSMFLMVAYALIISGLLTEMKYILDVRDDLGNLMINRTLWFFIMGCLEFLVLLFRVNGFKVFGVVYASVAFFLYLGAFGFYLELKGLSCGTETQP